MRTIHKLVGAVALGLALPFILWLLAALPRASAQRLDPNVPARITVGPPPGHCPMSRVDPRRSGRTLELPPVPKEIWHRRVRGGISLPAAVDDAGAVIVAAAVAEVIQIGPDGTEQWNRRLGMSIASTEPVILSDGTRVVLTALGHAWGYDSQGELRFRTDLANFGMDPRTSPLPRNDGTVVVAVGTHVMRLDSQGSIVSQDNVGQRVVGNLVDDGDDVLLTTEAGDVFRWSFSIPPRRLGSFRGIVRDGAVRTEDGFLLSVVDTQRLVAMNLVSGTMATRLSLFGLEGPPTLDGKGMALITTNTGDLLTISPAGEERRVRLDPTPEPPPDVDAGIVVPSYLPPSPAVILDEAGRVAFARSDGRVGVVSPEGQVRYAGKISCSTPISVTPAGRGKFVVACRTGDLYLYGP